MPRSIIVAVINQKGGVGKTTTVANLAVALAAGEQKILAIDLDSQGSLSSSFGLENAQRANTIYEVMTSQISIKSAIIKNQEHLVDLISATVDLAALEVELANVYNKEHKLKGILAPLTDEYDYILIDCPPALGLLSLNALFAANQVLVPIQCEYLALEGLSYLLKIIDLLKQRGKNPSLKILGLLMTMYDKRARLTKLVEQDVRSCLGELAFETVIPRNVRIAEAPSYGKPVIIYDHQSTGALAYLKLAQEILLRNKNL